ncbi:MAG: purine-binding chemotaxis protein CheW [Fibrobacter sp.]|nr:purine-binding chemotaxis protein CheW [Fibrobacter sp.]
MSENLEVNVDNSLLVATFTIDNASFGIDANLVQEVVQVRKNSPVHHAPRYIRGVMNLRGRVITIVDLGEKLSLGEIPHCDENRILIVEWKQEYVGLLVDKITEVVPIEKSLVREPPGNVHGVQASLIAGVFQNASGLLIGLLDTNKILDVDENEYTGVSNIKKE